jgi:hypothetical protein
MDAFDSFEPLCGEKAPRRILGANDRHAGYGSHFGNALNLKAKSFPQELVSINIQPCLNIGAKETHPGYRRSHLVGSFMKMRAELHLRVDAQVERRFLSQRD